MRKMRNAFLLAIVLILGEVSRGFAQTFVANPNSRAQGNLGTVADNLTNATGLFQSVLTSLFYVIGIMFIFGGLIRYYEHRKNPSQTPLGRVVFLLLAGIVVTSFPFVVDYLGAKFAQSA